MVAIGTRKVRTCSRKRGRPVARGSRLCSISPEPASSKKAKADSQAISTENSREDPRCPDPCELRNAPCKSVLPANNTGARLHRHARSRHSAVLNRSTRPFKATRLKMRQAHGQSRQLRGQEFGGLRAPPLFQRRFRAPPAQELRRETGGSPATFRRQARLGWPSLSAAPPRG